MSNQNTFLSVPQITLPNGIIVPAFQVGQYLTSKDENGLAVVTGEGTPWTRIDYFAANAAAAAAGFKLIAELQWLALAHDIANQDENWTGGKVGHGALYQGLHKHSINEAQSGEYESTDPAERRWHVLSTGDRIYDMAGHLFSWVRDDVQGDDAGLIAKPFAEDSPSLTTAPAPSLEIGVGWRPRAGSDWSGRALARGGCWSSDVLAGVFLLNYDWPDDEDDVIGFRSTK